MNSIFYIFCKFWNLSTSTNHKPKKSCKDFRIIVANGENICTIQYDEALSGRIKTRFIAMGRNAHGYEDYGLSGLTIIRWGAVAILRWAHD